VENETTLFAKSKDYVESATNGTTELAFTVYGTPVPQGSTRAFIPKGWNRPIITAANAKTKPWKQEIAGVVLAEMERTGFQPIADGPVWIEVLFYFERPKSVKSRHKTTKPDIDKLIRSLLDALTGHLFKDDAQVTSCRAMKVFTTEAARCEVKIGRVW
jgi:Holliday junction resolvase RusA-like endonuclease